MVHAAKTEQAMTLGALCRPNGYGHAPLERIDSSGGQGWFTAHDDAFAVHGVVSSLPEVEASLPEGCVGRAGPGLSAGVLPDVCESFFVRSAQIVMVSAIDGRRP